MHKSQRIGSVLHTLDPVVHPETATSRPKTAWQGKEIEIISVRQNLYKTETKINNKFICVLL